MLTGMAPALVPESGHEHPVVAWAGILAILSAMLLIAWARFEVHGTGDFEAALAESDPGAASARRELSPDGDRTAHEVALDKAVAAGRWAAGFTP